MMSYHKAIRVRRFTQNSFCVLISLWFIFSSVSYSQTADSLKIRPDSLQTKIDTSKTSSSIDSMVTYTANDSIVFTFDDKQMKMFGKSDVKYKDIGLKSERIDVNWNTNQLTSYGILDSTKKERTDTLKKLYTGTPIMTEGADKYDGWKISYNFKTQKGRVTLGGTSQDQGFYNGEQIKKMDRDMLFIANGYYTTCEYGHPHFYFFSPEMRVTVKDKIVARPIYLYISDVPIFALPFGVFPSQGGRRSGIIAPTFVDQGSRGTGLEHFGYYWAMSEYTDLAVLGDWLTSGTYRVSPNFRYAKRYDFTGSLSGYYQRTFENEPNDNDYVNKADYYANLRHNQRFNPTTNLDVNFTFASSENYRRALTLTDLLNQEITSNATLSKSWEGTNSSMSANIGRTQNLITGSITNVLPSISYSHAQTYPFRSEKRNRNPSSDNSFSWYEMIGMSYNSQYQRVDNKTRPTDTAAFTLYERQGVNHSLSFNAAPKAGYFTISPALSYNERWYDKSTRLVSVDTSTNAPITEDKKGLEAVRTFGLGVSASTKLYGIFQPPIPGVAGFRHTLTPSIGYNYTPDFSKPSFGYYQTYKDKFGVEQKFNRFQREIYGGASAGEQQAISLSVGNVFEMKTSAADTSQKEEKYQLLNLGLSTNYNFAADKFKLSDLSVNYRTQIGEYLSINGNSNYRFYEFDQATNSRVDRYLWERGKGIVEMTNFSLNLSTSLRGERKKAQTQQQVSDSARIAEDTRNKAFNGNRSIYDSGEPDFSIPWSMSLSFSFAQNQENPQQKSRSANISGNLDFNLTENWKFTASTSYDITHKQLAAPQINISRDLHCWLMNFQWTPIGYAAGYRFEIRVKAPQLQDIKLTKQNNDRL
ncbi:MAG: LPS assembly protein LptD [Bacteroidota bacterium]|nr:LPS assembly protein LptD [Bacteroidota bacterium]